MGQQSAGFMAQLDTIECLNNTVGPGNMPFLAYSSQHPQAVCAPAGWGVWELQAKSTTTFPGSVEQPNFKNMTMCFLIHFDLTGP